MVFNTPIGGLQVEQERIFNSTTIDISIPTTFYLYTDGFQDQFGGEKGRKYMVKKFKEFLLSISNWDTKEQREILEKEFHSWKNEHHQVDDVLVIGINL